MRSRRSVDDRVAEVARRRLELLSAELAEIRPVAVESPAPLGRDGSGEPTDHSFDGSRDPSDNPPDDLPVDPSPPASSGRHAHRPLGAAPMVGGWVRDRVPPAWQGRLAMGPAHLGVVAVLVLVGLGATAWFVMAARTGPSVLPPAASSPSVPAAAATGFPLTPGPASTDGASAGVPAGAPTSPPSTSPASGSSMAGVPVPGDAASVVVDVAGRVHRPGIATLPSGSRVADALRAAGGVRAGVRLQSLNLARVLVDGEQILVGVRLPPGPAASAASVPDAAVPSGSTAAIPMVDINTAGVTGLDVLPGVGPVTAQAIADYRTQNGSFTSVDQLLEVSGIGDATLAKIAPYCTL